MSNTDMEEIIGTEGVEALNEMTRMSLLIPLARYIHRNNLLSDDKPHSQIFVGFVTAILEAEEYTPELHTETLEAHAESITILTKKEKYLSASVLVAISLEEYINSLLRICCSAKGHSNKSITNYIKETSIKVKVDLVLPLLGLEIEEQLRNAIFQYWPLRNKVVHGKAVPGFLRDDDIPNSIESNAEKAMELIKHYPIEKLTEYVLNTESKLENVPELRLAHSILAPRFTQQP